MLCTKKETKLFKELASILTCSTKKRMTRAEKKEKGKKYCHYAGYGFRWTRSGKRAACLEERRVMWLIVQLREEKGLSWRKIFSALLEAKIRTRNGRIWSSQRIQRAYQAAVRMRSEYHSRQPQQEVPHEPVPQEA